MKTKENIKQKENQGKRRMKEQVGRISQYLVEVD